MYKEIHCREILALLSVACLQLIFDLTCDKDSITFLVPADGKQQPRSFRPAGTIRPFCRKTFPLSRESRKEDTIVKNKFILWLLTLGCLVAFGIYLAEIGGSSHANVPATTSNKKEVRSLNYLPTAKATPPSIEKASELGYASVEFEGIDHLSQSTAKRASKYGNGPIRTIWPGVIKDSVIETTIDWVAGAPALPVDKSALIVVGRLNQSRAHLSPNKHQVFTEFQIQIEKVFKNDSRTLLDKSNLYAERVGGIVVFPNGARLWHRFRGQNMPQVGERYIFFLSHSFPQHGVQEGDLFLLTAYHLTNGRIFPLDRPDGGTHPIARTYVGTDKKSFFSDLKEELARPNSEGGREK